MDRSLVPCRVEDVRSQPVERDEGYETMDQSGQGPKYTEVVRCLLHFADRINRNDMIYLIVDNRNPADVSHWPSFAKWWTSRRRLVGPHREKTDVLWVTANHQNALRDVPYYWAGVFVLEVARFLYPRQHFGLIDNDCVPVSLFEMPDLVALATSQLTWTDPVGLAPDDQRHANKVGLLLVTEAHLEYNAGLVISLGSQGGPSPITQHSTAETLADDLADYRSQSLAMARPPGNPTGTMLPPLVGAPMENSRHAVGTYMCKTFWPRPVMPPHSTDMTDEPQPIRWPKKAHPAALSEAGRERTPWLTRWARATFEQGECESKNHDHDKQCREGTRSRT